MTEIGKVSESLEDYLKIIFQLERERRVARVKDIAARKGVRMASVTGALRRMSKEGLVHYGAREFVELTDQGAELARKILQRNDFLKQFLTITLGLDGPTAEHDACALEHHLSEDTLARLAAFYQFIDTYGHSRNLSKFLEDGATIPCEGCPNRSAEDGHTDLRPLSDLEPGCRGKVSGLGGDALKRLRLVEMGILPQVNLSLESHHNGAVKVCIKGSMVNLTEEQAAAVRVVPLSS